MWIYFLLGIYNWDLRQPYVVKLFKCTVYGCIKIYPKGKLVD